jgi:hypothetical protein
MLVTKAKLYIPNANLFDPTKKGMIHGELKQFMN